MAINPASQYPGQITPPSADYPYGSARDVSSPGAGDGTPVQQAWVNDWFGFQQRVLQAAGITPSGNPDTGIASDVFNGLIGRLINIRTLTASGTYTPTAGTRRIVVEAVGGGGGGGGSGATASTQSAAGGGGAAGGYVLQTFTSGFSSVPYSIGVGGTAGNNSSGGNGGATTFLTISAGGGGGGFVGAASTGGSTSGSSPGVASGGIINARGNFGRGGVVYSSQLVSISGEGGGSRLFPGGGGAGRTSTGDGFPATDPGCGGSGSTSNTSGAARAGGVGAAGIILIWEYS